MVLKSIDGGMLKEMYLSGCALLNQNREAVDALNVFPVPDGDTGTNMSQTMNAAVKGAEQPAVFQRIGCSQRRRPRCAARRARQFRRYSQPDSSRHRFRP